MTSKRISTRGVKPQVPRQTGAVVPFLLNADEIVFLHQALQNLPMSGTPDQLAQAIPMVQGLRLKVMQAGLAIGQKDHRPD